MVGSLFGDTIKYTYKGEIKIKENVTFKRADDKYIHYISSSRTFNKIECKNVVEIISDNGDNIDFSCLNPSPVIEKEPDKKTVKTKPQNKPIPPSQFTARQVGGGFISIGAFTLYNTLNKECDNCTTTAGSANYLANEQALRNLQDFADEIKQSQEMGYIFIFLGGLFILLDKEDTKNSENVKPYSQNNSLNFNFQPTYQGANLTMSYDLD